MFFKREIHQSYFVVFLAIGIIIGVVLGINFRINYFNSTIWLYSIGLLLIYSYIKPKYVFLIISLICGMILAFFRISFELKGLDYMRQLYNQAVIVSGIIEGDPETSETGTSFKIADLRFSEEEIKCSGNIYVSSYKNETIERGDKIVLKGKFTEGFGTYGGYMYRPEIVSLYRPEPGDLVLKIRNHFANRIRSLIPESEVSLGLSYLLGMKAGLSDELDENLRTVGLVHIVVASGAHLSILVEIARKMFGRVSRFSGLLFSILFILFFMCMVGWTPSILRAGVMSILTVVAWFSGRKIAPWRIILTVMAFTLMINPMFIINLGWLLSFSSYIGIMILGPKLTAYFYGDKKPKFLSSMILTTISATIMTLPIILYYYGQISLISVIANILILPTLSYAMGLVFMTGVMAGIPGISMVVAWFSKMILDYHIMIVEWFGGMKQFLIEMPRYQWQVFLLYIVIIIMILASWIKRKNKRIYGIMET